MKITNSRAVKRMTAQGRVISILPLFICGLAFLTLTPPFQNADEPEHFDRIVQLSQFEILGTQLGTPKAPAGGGPIPVSIIEASRPFMRLRFDERQKLTFSQFTEALAASRPLDAKAMRDKRNQVIPSYVLVSPVPYLPQMIAVILGKLFSASPLELLYLARLGNLLFNMILIWVALNALEFSPRLRLAAFITAGIPMNLSLMASASNNAAVDTFALCLVAVGANLRQKFTHRTFVLYLLFTTLMSLSKSIYFVLPLALLPTIWSQTTGRARWQRVSLLMSVSTIPMLAWSLAAKGLYSPLRPGVDPMGALMLALHQPLATLHIFASSTKTYLTFYKETFISRVGWHDVDVPYRVVKYYFYALLLVAFLGPKNGKEQAFPKLHRFWIILVAFGTAIVTYVTIFLTWSPVGASVVEGVQGRHFLPVLPLLFLAAWPIFKLKSVFWKAWSTLLLASWGVAVTITLYCTATRYWIF